MDHELTLSSKIIENLALIVTSGYLNNAGGDKIAEEADKYIDQGITKILLDLKETTIVNSIGISILIEVLEKLDDVEGRLIFMNLDPTVEKTFNIMGLLQFTDSVESIEAAVSL